MASNETSAPQQIEGVLRAFEEGDTVAASEFWGEDGVFIDPHYPDPVYRGPTQIRQALDWALDTIVEEPGLSVRNVWEDEAGVTFAVEVDTHHTMQDGTETDFPQAFIVETEDSQIARWQSYLPYPPPDEGE